MEQSNLVAAALLIGAYLAGSIPFGPLIARTRGIDLRKVGSGNIGATNAMRALGKPAGAAVLVLDALKGAAATAVARWLAPEQSWVAPACAFFAVLGHCHPVWLRFRGGKGVATSLGVFAVLDPLATAISVAVFAAIYALRRVVSLGSLAAAVTLPLALVALGRPPILIVFAVATLLLIVARHKDNIARWRRGKEPST